jgi:intein/homing endonuclease
MQKTIINTELEKLIIIGLIVSDKFCKNIIQIIDIQLLKLSYSKVIAKWCIDFYKKYKKAPHADIQNIYNNYLSEMHNEEDENLIKLFLEHISNNYEREQNYNEDYALDQAIKYLKQRKLKLLKLQIDELTTNGQEEEAEKLIAEYKKVQLPVNDCIDVFNDIKVVDEVLNWEEEDLFTFAGELGKAIRNLTRGDLIAFAAPAKRGKTVCFNTEILFADGSVKTIKEIYDNKINNPIISLNENYYKLESDNITDWIYSGKKECIKIITKTGREIECALTHPFLHFSKGWIESKELKEKDFICCPKNINFFGNNELKESEIKLIAYLIADGSLTTSSYIFTKKEIEIKNDFRNCVIDIGDVFSILDNFDDNIIRKNKSEKSNIQKLFEKYNIKRCKSIYKEIPDIIFTLKKGLISLFLNILFTCDGSIYGDKKNVEIQYSSGSKKLIYQVQSLLLRFGIISSVKEKKVKNLDHIYYGLNIRDKQNILLFLDNIGFSFSKKEKAEKLKIILEFKRDNFSFIDKFPFEFKKIIHQEINKFKIKNNIQYKDLLRFKPIKNILNELNRKVGIKKYNVIQINEIIKSDILNKYLDNDIFWDQIEEIKYIGYQECYDLSIEKNHNYIANNFITHNSFLLIETAIRAVVLGLRVIFFSLEMPKNQVLSRIYQNILGESKKEKEVIIPKFKLNANNKYTVETTCIKKQGLQSNAVKTKIRNLKMILKSGKLKLFCNSPHNISVNDISNISDNLVNTENFVADMIIIDFADIVKSDYKANEHRHKLNNVWEQLRALALQKHCLVVTATHTNKSTFDRDMKQGDMSEDIRKINHVSLMLGINQKKDEKKKGLARIIVLANRADEFFVDDEIAILQCLNIGKPLLDSKMKKDCDDKEFEK